MEAFAPVRSIAGLMADFPGRWGFCGGWAIDLFLDRPTRPHKDVDVAVLRRDQASLYRHLSARGWSLETAHEGTLTRWDSAPLALPVHTLWCNHPRHDPSFLEVLFNEDDGDHFLFRRDLSIRLRLENAFVRSPDGWPLLAPEIVLLYKSKYRDEDDSRGDFLNALPALDERQRTWLREAISTLYGSHEWLKALE